MDVGCDFTPDFTAFSCSRFQVGLHAPLLLLFDLASVCGGRASLNDSQLSVGTFCFGLSVLFIGRDHVDTVAAPAGRHCCDGDHVVCRQCRCRHVAFESQYSHSNPLYFHFSGICARSVVFTNTSGVITDGPGNYADVMQCKWILSAPAGNYISLYVDSFNTECGYEFYF